MIQSRSRELEPARSNPRDRFHGNVAPGREQLELTRGEARRPEVE